MANLFECECHWSSLLPVIERLLGETEKLLRQKEPSALKILKKLEASVQKMREFQQDHGQFRAEYARDMIELVKSGIINLGPMQDRLQMVERKKL
jgi:hypothetical protein